MKKFTEALEALMREHGMELSAIPEATLGRPRLEAFISHDMSVDAFQATRERQPFDLRITAKASVYGAWHHDSGDDRRLHPDLRSNAVGKPTPD